VFAPAGWPVGEGRVAPGRGPGPDGQARQEGRSSYEIFAQLSGEGTPLNCTSVAENVAEEGFGRLSRRLELTKSISPGTERDTTPPRAKLSSSPTCPERLDTVRAHRPSPPSEPTVRAHRLGPAALVLPDLVAFDLRAWSVLLTIPSPP